MTERTRLLVAIVVAIAMLVTACGAESADTQVLDDPDEAAAMAAATRVDGDDSATTSSAGPAAAETDAPAGDAGDGDGGAASADPDSLEEYLGVAAIAVRGGGTRGGAGALAGVDTDQLAQEQQLIQLEIQKCMQAQGFEYVPEETTGGLRFFLRNEDAGLSAREYAESQGFGISTAFDELFGGDIELTDAEPSPNEELVATLSEGEAEAWLYALRGEPPLRDEQGRLIDPDTGEVIQGQGPGRAAGGCQLDAQIAVRGDLSLLGDLSTAWEALEERIDADPRIAEIERNWTTCMLDRGFDYEDPDEARADFQAQFRPLMISFVQQSGLAGGGQGQDGGGRLGVLQDLADQGLTVEQELELASLQRREIEAAVATLDCAGDEQEVTEIRAAYEAEFVAENRDLLESFAA